MCRASAPRRLTVTRMVVSRLFVERRALVLLEAALECRWTVVALADALGVSRATLARAFAESSDGTPMRALTRLRMAMAEAMLRESDASLIVIASRVGYESEFALSRALKRWTGCAPTHYRRACRSAA